MQIAKHFIFLYYDTEGEGETPKREASSRPGVDPLDLSDEARERYVRSDGARKRAAYFYINNGTPVPPKLLYRAVPEFDRLHAAARSGQGSSSGAGDGSSSGAGSSSRAMVRRVPLPSEEEEGAEGYDPAAFGRSLSALDFVPENAVVATICERSAAEEPELEAQRRHAKAVDETLVQKAIEVSLEDPIPVPSDEE